MRLSIGKTPSRMYNGDLYAILYAEELSDPWKHCKSAFGSREAALELSEVMSEEAEGSTYKCLQP